MSNMEKNEDRKKEYKNMMVQAQNKNFSQRIEDYINRNVPINLQGRSSIAGGRAGRIIPLSALPNQFGAIRRERINEILSQTRTSTHNLANRIPAYLILHPKGKLSSGQSQKQSSENLEASDLKLADDYRIIKIPPQPGQTQPTIIRIPKDFHGVYHLRPSSIEDPVHKLAYPYKKPPDRT